MHRLVLILATMSATQIARATPEPYQAPDPDVLRIDAAVEQIAADVRKGCGTLVPHQVVVRPVRRGCAP